MSGLQDKTASNINKNKTFLILLGLGRRLQPLVGNPYCGIPLHVIVITIEVPAVAELGVHNSARCRAFLADLELDTDMAL